MPLDMHESALFARALACFKDRQYRQVEEICTQILNRNKKAVEVMELLTEVHLRRQHPAEAASLLKHGLTNVPGDVRLQLMLGRVLISIGDFDEAIAILEKVREERPGDTACIAMLADAWRRRGEDEEARSLLKPLIDAGTEDVAMAGTWARLEMDGRRPQNAVDIINKHISRGPVHFSLMFHLGKAYEKLGDVDRAFQTYQIANTLVRNTFDLNQYVALCDEVVSTFSAANVKHLPRAGTVSSLPIYVSGRPRSGTTLVERILNAHPAVYSEGESQVLPQMIASIAARTGSTQAYPRCVLDLTREHVEQFSHEYLEGLNQRSGHAKRVIDKGMGLHGYLAFVQMIVPMARVIWVRREAIDNNFACYTENLVFGQAYAQDLRHLGITHRFHEMLMRHWQSVLDLPILEVNYEDLVENPEHWSRQIVSFCGLEWSDDCLRFHDQEQIGGRSKARPTLSHAQVRNPVYKTSVGRAELFRKHLQPLVDALAEGDAMVKSRNSGKDVLAALTAPSA